MAEILSFCTYETFHLQLVIVSHVCSLNVVQTRLPIFLPFASSALVKCSCYLNFSLKT